MTRDILAYKRGRTERLYARATPEVKRQLDELIKARKKDDPLFSLADWIAEKLAEERQQAK